MRLIGWWHHNVNAGRVHEHPANPGGGWSAASHRLCERVAVLARCRYMIGNEDGPTAWCRLTEYHEGDHDLDYDFDLDAVDLERMVLHDIHDESEF